MSLNKSCNLPRGPGEAATLTLSLDLNLQIAPPFFKFKLGFLGAPAQPTATPTKIDLLISTKNEVQDACKFRPRLNSTGTDGARARAHTHQRAASRRARRLGPRRRFLRRRHRFRQKPPGKSSAPTNRRPRPWKSTPGTACGRGRRTKNQVPCRHTHTTVAVDRPCVEF